MLDVATQRTEVEVCFIFFFWSIEIIGTYSVAVILRGECLKWKQNLHFCFVLWLFCCHLFFLCCNSPLLLTFERLSAVLEKEDLITNITDSLNNEVLLQTPIRAAYPCVHLVDWWVRLCSVHTNRRSFLSLGAVWTRHDCQMCFTMNCFCFFHTFFRVNRIWSHGCPSVCVQQKNKKEKEGNMKDDCLKTERGDGGMDKCEGSL